MQIYQYEFSVPAKPGTVLGCSGGRVKQDNPADEDCICRILALRVDDQDHFFVTIDALYIGATLDDRIRSILSPLGGSVFSVGATHSHSMPNISIEHEYFGTVDSDYLDQIVSGIEQFADLYQGGVHFDDVISMELRQLLNDRVSFRRKKVQRPYIDVRRITDRETNQISRTLSLKASGVVMAPEQNYPIDTLGVCVVIHTSSKAYALYALSVHPTNIHDIVSRDMYSNVDAMLATEAANLWGCHGFGADIKLAIDSGNGGDLRGVVRQIALGPSYRRIERSNLENALSNTTHQLINQSTGEADLTVTSNTMETVTAALGTLQDGEPVVYRMEVGKVGPLVFVTANCEVSHMYHREFAEVLSADHWLVPISCTGACIGYLPHYSYIGEGGYEDEKFVEYFGLTGALDTNLTQNFIQRVKHVLTEL